VKTGATEQPERRSAHDDSTIAKKIRTERTPFQDFEGNIALVRIQEITKKAQKTDWDENCWLYITQWRNESTK